MSGVGRHVLSESQLVVLRLIRTHVCPFSHLVVSPLRLPCTAPDPQDGDTPLYKAILENHTEVALALIEKGANVDAANEVRGHGVGGRSVGAWVERWAE